MADSERDRGARALAERLPRPTFPSRPTVLMFGTREQVAAAILANGAAFLPDGFPNGWHAFRDVNPDAECPTCGFPAWTHDPGMAVLHGRTILPDAAELERLRRIEAAAREALTLHGNGYPKEARAALAVALRAVQRAEGSAPDGG